MRQHHISQDVDEFLAAQAFADPGRRIFTAKLANERGRMQAPIPGRPDGYEVVAPDVVGILRA